MTRLLKSAALALGLSLIGTAALAADCCSKDKDGKMECCCDKMGAKGHAAPKPDGQKPAAPQDGEHKDHKH